MGLTYLASRFLQHGGGGQHDPSGTAASFSYPAMGLLACSVAASIGAGILLNAMPLLAPDERELIDAISKPGQIPDAQDLKKVVDLCRGNHSFNKRLVEMLSRDKSNNKYPFVASLSFFCQHFDTVSPDALMKKMDLMVQDEACTLSLDHNEFCAIVKGESINLLFAEKGWTNPDPELQLFSAKCAEFLDKMEVGTKHPEGVFIALNDVQRYLTNQKAFSFTSAIKQAKHAHASFLLNDPTSRDIGMGKDGLTTTPLRDRRISQWGSRLLFYKFFEIDISSLIEESNKGFLASISQEEMSKRFYSAVKAKLIDRLRVDDCSPNRIWLDTQVGKSLFFKSGEGQREKTAAFKPMEPLICSAFVAKSIHEGVQELNSQLRQLPEVTSYFEEKGQEVPHQLVTSPFPEDCNLNKVTPSDLAYNFPGLKPAYFHLGKLASRLQN